MILKDIVRPKNKETEEFLLSLYDTEVYQKEGIVFKKTKAGIEVLGLVRTVQRCKDCIFHPKDFTPYQSSLDGMIYFKSCISNLCRY